MLAWLVKIKKGSGTEPAGTSQSESIRDFLVLSELSEWVHAISVLYRSVSGVCGPSQYTSNPDIHRFFFHTSSDSLNCRGCISQPFDLRASALLCPETELCPLSCFVLCPLHCPIMAELYRKKPPTSLTLSCCLILCVKYDKNVERRVFPLCLFLFVLFNFY